MTSFIPPQLLAPARQLPTGPIWRYELKYDGYRAQVHVTAHGVRILTRTGLDWTDRFPQLIKELAAAVQGARSVTFGPMMLFARRAFHFI